MDEIVAPLPPALSPPPLASTQPSSAPPVGIKPAHLIRFEEQKKSAGIAFVLCWMLGLFGAHRFYLGRSQAITMLLITLVSIPLCLVLVGFAGILAVWVWMIVDLFCVSQWVREYNVRLLERIAGGTPQ